MNEEEIKAIEILKSFINQVEEYEDEQELIKAIQIMLNFLEKQQKEIKARLEEIDSLYKMMSIKDDKIDYLADKIEQMEEDYVSKDKIREKLEEIENSNTISIKGMFDFLKELLGE